MRSTRCGSTASSKAASSRAGACCAAIPGVAAEWITRDLPRAPAAARASLPAHPQRTAPGGPAVGVVDRRADGDRADVARTADRAPDPLDAEHAALRAPDEGDPEEVQGRPAEAQRGADEVLQGEQHQPGRLVPAAPSAVPRLHRPLLHVAHVREASAGRKPLVVALRAEYRCARNNVLVRIRPSGGLRREPARVDVLHGRDDAALAARDDVLPSVRLHRRDRALSDWARSLLDDDEPVDRRPGADHAATDPEDAATGDAQALVPDAAERGGGGGGIRGRRRCPGDAVPACAAAPGAEEEEEAPGTEMSDLQIETTGETVGEAKWAALRELEKQQPGLDKSAVRFQVVSEGERGLLGVGYTPARVLATVDAGAATAEYLDESELAAEERTLVEQIVTGLGVSGRLDMQEDDETITVTCAGPDLGMLIGRHGQTIDAIQYLANAIVYRSHPDDRKEVVIDAAGYRARRRASLEALAVRSAQRAVQIGEPVELEPMTAVERKVVHIRLKEFPGVETSSEGTEPNRFIVITPV